MEMFSRLMTAVSTWKLQGLNPLQEFRKYVYADLIIDGQALSAFVRHRG